MAMICNDFIAIAKELEEYYNVFTPELKSVTGKPHKINEILERVHKVLELIEHVSRGRGVRALIAVVLVLRHRAIHSGFKISTSGKWSWETTRNRSKKSTSKRKASFRSHSKAYGEYSWHRT